MSFTTFLNTSQPDTLVIHRPEVQPMVADGGRYRLYPFFPIEDGRRFEVYTIEIEPGGCLGAEAHPEGTQEFLTVFAGELSVLVDEQEYRVPQGDSIRFRADRPARYQNSGDELARINLVIHYA